MTLLIGVASGLAAVAALPRWRMSTFLTLLCDLFAIETVLFGLADLVALMGYWPQSLAEYELPRYLPLATALFVLAIFAVSHFRLVRRMMRIADPFFAARTPISIRPLPYRPFILRQDVYARINVFFLILINQFQVALALRFNFFQRDFGNAIQVADEAHRVAFWYQLHGRLRAAGDDRHRRRHRRVLRRLEFRAAMAPMDDGLVHLALAHALDALQAGAHR